MSDKWRIYKCRRGHAHWHVDGPDENGWDDGEFPTGNQAIGWINHRLTPPKPHPATGKRIEVTTSGATNPGKRGPTQAPTVSGLRDQVVDIIAQHDHYDYAGELVCHCGATFDDHDMVDQIDNWAKHLTTILIAKLGLQQEWGAAVRENPTTTTRDRAERDLQNAIVEDKRWYPGQKPRPPANPRIITRYVTEWQAEQ